VSTLLTSFLTTQLPDVLGQRGRKWEGGREKGQGKRRVKTRKPRLPSCRAAFLE
jgi:hypothetical protein